MLGPRCIALGVLWLLPPAVFLEDVHLAVAVDVADAQAVGEALVAFAARRDGMESPRLGGVFPVGGGVAELAAFFVGTAGDADDVGLAVAVDVLKGRRLVVDHV